jgi:dihydroceramidase
MTNNSGFWGPPTSSIDWCESNYLHNYYIAETFNTASNAFYLVTSLGAMYRTYRSIRSQKKIQLFDLSRFYLMYTFGLLVCIGSFLFHATLLKKFQLLDELPMMYRYDPFTSSITHSQLVVFYIAFFLDDIIKPYSIGLKTLVGGSILLLGIGITIMMLWWPTVRKRSTINT